MDLPALFSHKQGTACDLNVSNVKSNVKHSEMHK